jgi:hypothetical protein
MKSKTNICKGKGCEMIIPESWGDFCSCCFYEGMNPAEFEKLRNAGPTASENQKPYE